LIRFCDRWVSNPSDIVSIFNGGPASSHPPHFDFLGAFCLFYNLLKTSPPHAISNGAKPPLLLFQWALSFWIHQTFKMDTTPASTPPSPPPPLKPHPPAPPPQPPHLTHPLAQRWSSPISSTPSAGYAFRVGHSVDPTPTLTITPPPSRPTPTPP